MGIGLTINAHGGSDATVVLIISRISSGVGCIVGDAKASTGGATYV